MIFMASTLFIRSRASLVRLRRIALQAVYHGSLGHPQIDPVLSELLEPDEEFRASFPRLVVHLLTSPEFDLIGELADERLVLTPGAPKRNIGPGSYSFAEIQQSEVLQHLLDDRLIDQFYPLVPVLLKHIQGRECLYQR